MSRSGASSAGDGSPSRDTINGTAPDGARIGRDGHGNGRRQHGNRASDERQMSGERAANGRQSDDKRLPFLRFFPADWRADPALRASSIAARGFWIECLAMMHEGAPYGHLTIAGQVPTDQELARQMAIAPSEVKRLTAELLRRGIASRTDGGVLYSRRLVRDAARRARAVADGRRGGNPDLAIDPASLDDQVKGGVKGQVMGGVKGQVKGSLKARARAIAGARWPLASSSTNAVQRDQRDQRDDLDQRAGAFCQRFRWTLYPRHQDGVAYTPSRAVEDRDLDSARTLVAAYTDEQLDRVAETFLSINGDGHDLIKDSARTISKLTIFAPEIAKRLQIKAGA